MRPSSIGGGPVRASNAVPSWSAKSKKCPSNCETIGSRKRFSIDTAPTLCGGISFRRSLREFRHLQRTGHQGRDSRVFVAAVERVWLFCAVRQPGRVFPESRTDRDVADLEMDVLGRAANYRPVESRGELDRWIMANFSKRRTALSNGWTPTTILWRPTPYQALSMP
jgi:hypothetical protein